MSMSAMIKLSSKVWLVLASEQNAQYVAAQLSCEVSVVIVDLAPFESKVHAARAMQDEVRLLPFSLSEICQFDALMQCSSSNNISVPL